MTDPLNIIMRLFINLYSLYYANVKLSIALSIVFLPKNKWATGGQCLSKTTDIQLTLAKFQNSHQQGDST